MEDIFISDNCHALLDVKRSLAMGNREQLYKDLDGTGFDPDYRRVLLALLSKAEKDEQHEKERENVINIGENDENDGDKDPEYQSVLHNLKEHGNSYALEGERRDDVPVIVKYEGEWSSDDDRQPEPGRKMRMQPEACANGRVRNPGKQMNQSVRRQVNAKKNDLSKQKHGVLLQNQHGCDKHAPSNRKTNAESCKVSEGMRKGKNLVQVEDGALSKPGQDGLVRLSKKDWIQEMPRKVVDLEYVDKRNSAIKKEGAVHKNIYQRPGPKKKAVTQNQRERVEATPSNVKDKVQDQIKLVKGKNVVGGGHEPNRKAMGQIDQGRSSQKSTPCNYQLIKNVIEQVLAEKDMAPSERGLKKPGARTCSVTESDHDQAKKGEGQSRKKLKEVVIIDDVVKEEKESSLEIIAPRTARTAKKQLDHYPQGRSGTKSTTPKLRNVQAIESSRRKNNYKSNQKKESDDEASDVEILDSAAFFEGNRSPFVPSKTEIRIEHSGCPNERSEFREKLFNILKKPFDKEEYRKHQDTFQNGTYRNCYPDVKAKLVDYRYNKEKRLTILRGFFFWVENLTHRDAFHPWTDRECLEMEPGSE